jgi:hypothetical protein
MNSHSHNVAFGDSDEDFGDCDPGGSGVPKHTHSSKSIGGASGGSLTSQSVTWDSVNHEPPYYEVIYIKPSGGFAAIKTGVIGMWESSSVPSGFDFCNGGGSTPDLRNKYPKGAGTSQNAGTTGGSLNHGHDIGHTHTSSNHSHSGTSTSASTPHGNRQSFFDTPIVLARTSHTHPITLENTSQAINSYSNSSAGNGDTVEPAYKKLLAIRASNNTSNPPKGLIGVFLGAIASIPPGWVLCDGTNDTPDMRGKYLKFANTTGEGGDTGGSNTHQHSSVSHTHTANGTHSHTVSHGTESSYGSRNGGAGQGFAP